MALWETPSGSTSVSRKIIGWPAVTTVGTVATWTVIGRSAAGAGSNRNGPQAGSVLLRHGATVVVVDVDGVGVPGVAAGPSSVRSTALTVRTSDSTTPSPGEAFAAVA